MTEMSIEMAGKVDVKEMTKTERRELRQIVRRRFRMLRDQLHRRERELEYALRQQFEKERKTEVAKVEKRLKTLFEQHNKVVEKFDALREEAAAKGLSIAYGAHPNWMHWRPDQQPVRATSERELHERIDQIKEEAGWGKLNLNEMEWQMDEQLAVGELESGSSLKFLESLPTVETLLPLPEGITVELPELEI